MLNQRRPAHAAVPQDGRPPQGEGGAAAPIGPELDAKALAGLRELDPTGQNRLMERVFAAFQSSTARLLPQLLQAQRNADRAGMRYVAHTLKSSAASVGGMKLSTLCADLETRIRLEEAGDLLPQVQALEDAAQSLVLALQHFREAHP